MSKRIVSPQHRSIFSPHINKLSAFSFSTNATDFEKKEKTSSETGKAFALLKGIGGHLWPSGPGSLSVKTRIGASLSLLVASKIINIQVPFLFKDIVDTLNVTSTATGAAIDPVFPMALICGYGIARFTVNASQEARNAIFAGVAQKAIRNVAQDVFRHLHSLDLNFHLTRQTGALSRTIERGSRSIDFVLKSMVFNVVPTALEIALVSGILAHQFGWEYAAVSFGTLSAYTAFTIGITQWRTHFRREMNALDNGR